MQVETAPPIRETDETENLRSRRFPSSKVRGCQPQSLPDCRCQTVRLPDCSASLEFPKLNGEASENAKSRVSARATRHAPPPTHQTQFKLDAVKPTTKQRHSSPRQRYPLPAPSTCSTQRLEVPLSYFVAHSPLCTSVATFPTASTSHFRILEEQQSYD